MNQIVELSGIVRNLPDERVPDGAMQEVINLRPKDGAWRPIGTKVSYTQYGLTDVRAIHKISETTKAYIGRSAGGFINYFFFRTAYGPSQVHTTALACTDNTRFASWHNVLMVSEGTSESLSIMLFDENELEYKVYDGTGGLSLLPDLPKITMNRVAGDTDSYDYHAEGPSEGMLEYEHLEYIKNTMIAEHTRMRAKKAELGYLTGTLLFVFAWEMVDGTIIKQSIPYKFMVSEMDVSLTIDPGPPIDFLIATVFEGYNLQYKLHCTAEWLTDIKGRYKNLIAGLNIYVSLPHSPEARDDGDLFSITINEHNPKIEDETYFLLKQISLSALVANTFSDITLETVKDLDTKAQVPLNSLSHHALFGKRLFVYNDRIFLSDIKNYPWNGGALSGLIEPFSQVTGQDYLVGIEFDIAVSSRHIVTVFTGWYTINYYNQNGDIDFWIRKPSNSMGSYWGYPDSRAKTARVFLAPSGGAPVKLWGTYPLTSLQDKNLSYTSSIEVVCQLSGLPNSALSTNLNYYYDENRIQACEINNPFYFPPINSYRVQGTVLGLSSNAVALSQGQFGQYPMYAFTSEGIWAMRIGTGELLITSVEPLSREVCNNPDSIQGIDGGSVFTTSKGLFVISGDKVIEISQPAEGPYASPLASLASYTSAIGNLSQYDVSGLICSTPFLTYLAGAIIGWNFREREIIVTNPNKNYSWVFNLDTKAWYKIGQTWDRFISDYPVIYGYKTVGNDLIYSDLTQEDFTAKVTVHIETRPLKFSPAAYKKLLRLLLDGWINDNDEYRFTVHLFGTTDRETWYKLSSTSYGSRTAMLTGRSLFSCKQFIVIAGGKVDELSYLRSMTVEFEERYHNKIRS